MANPHFEIKITKRSKRQSAVAGAAYQSGENLFSEYDQKHKDYRKKEGVVYTEIMLPSHAPPEYADREQLWNAVEAVENQWNSQLARRFVLALPREVPEELYPQMVQDYCNQFFVSKGMIVDFAIHDPKPPGHNPHCHVMLTMRAMDEHGKWLPKARKIYDLDENGERIRLPSGNWKSHKEDTVDWNEQYHGQEWRTGWETVQNRYLEMVNSPVRVDLRSYEKQGLDIIPTVHMGAAVTQMPEDAERKGLGTPATRAGIIEKLIATGFVERKKSRKSVVLVPANTGVSLITVLPEQLQSPLLTAEWEHKLKLVEHGELDADVFMAEISLMVSELVKTYSVIKGAEVLFPSGRDVVGKCPRCGSDVTESKKGFFCESNSCRFGLWRDNKFLTGKKITLTRKMAAALLKNGKFPVKGIFSEKTGKSYDAALVLSDDGTKSVYSLDFGKE